jgi:hypothetical protein
MSDGSLRLEVELTPQVRANEEPVTMTLRLVNVGTRPVVVNRRMLLNAPGTPPQYGEIRLRVEGLPGYKNEIAYHVRAGEPAPTDFVMLAPQECVERRYRLTDYESLHEVGPYRLVAEYRNVLPNLLKGLPAFVGSIESPTVAFAVK